MNRLLPISLLALTLTAADAAAQFKPAIDPPPGGVPANAAPSRFPPLTALKSESDNWAVREELTRVRVLMVGDTNDQIGGIFQTELNKMQELLTAAVGANKVDITVLKGTNASPDKILEYYRNLQTGKDEAIVFYYAGHGCMDRNRKFDPIWASGHMLGMKAGGLYRADLYKAIKAKKAGLTVLITDCCSSDDTTPNNPASINPNGRLVPAARASADHIRHVGRCLFLQHRGVMDMTAAMSGQFAYGNGETIGMTPALCRVFYSPHQFLPGGGRNFITWSDFHSSLNTEMWKMLAYQGANFTQLAPAFGHGRLASTPWVNELEGGGRSNWSFYHLGDGRYKALEFGMGNADGTARLSGHNLHIDFTTADGAISGAYDIDIDTGAAKCSFTTGPLAGRSVNGTFSEGEFDKQTNKVRKAE